jgi:hypothetical protein
MRTQLAAQNGRGGGGQAEREERGGVEGPLARAREIVAGQAGQRGARTALKKSADGCAAQRKNGPQACG